MTSSESGSEGIREEVEAQVRVATAELQRQLWVLQAQVADLQRQRQTKAEAEQLSGPSVDIGTAGRASQTWAGRSPTARELVLHAAREESAYGLVQGPEDKVEGEEESQDIEDLPETLFTYCMAQLAVNPESIVEPVVYLTVQIGIQLCLTLSFTNAAFGRFFDIHWTPRPSTPEMCLYHGNVINGHPYQDVAAAMCCFFLAAVAMMADDKERLSSIYPNGTHALHVRAVVTIFWCLQGFIVPLYLIAAIPVLMTNSMNSVDVVMNGLAVLFILDVDDMLYALVPLPRRDELKERLLTQRSAYRWIRLDPANLEVDAQIMGTFKFLYMAILYATFVVYVSPSHGQEMAARILPEYSNAYYHVESLFYFCMLPFISTFAWHKPSDARDTIATIGRAVFTVVFGVVIPYVALWSFHARVVGTPAASSAHLPLFRDTTSTFVACYETYQASGPPGGVPNQTW